MTVESFTGGNVKVRVNGCDIEYDAERCLQLWNGMPALTLWTESSLAGLMLGMQRMVGTERFCLSLQSGGRESVEGDWAYLAMFPTFEEGFERLGSAAAAAGWGRWILLSLDVERKRARFRVENGWESIYQKALGVCWGSSMIAGKFAGHCGRLFGVNCWARQTAFAARGDEADEFEVEPSERTVEGEVEHLLESDQATRADLAVALERLRLELAERTAMETTLRRAEERLRSYFHLDVVGVAFTTENGKWLEFNERLCNMLGRTHDELLSCTLPDVLSEPGSVPPTMSSLLPQSDVDGTSFERRFRRLDGAPLDANVILQRIRGRDGKVEHVLLLVHDITERTRIEQDLRAKVELVARQRQVISELAVPIIQVWDGVLTVPLTGVFDSGRTSDIMEKLLNEVVRVKAAFVLLDLTGVDIVDTATANRLMMLVRALSLLGAMGIVTGIRPSVAQTIVSLGADLATIRTFSTLRDGLRYCMRGDSGARHKRSDDVFG